MALTWHGVLSQDDGADVTAAAVELEGLARVGFVSRSNRAVLASLVRALLPFVY